MARHPPRISDTLRKATERPLTKHQKAKRFKRTHDKPDLKLNLPNVYKRAVEDGEVIEILPWAGPMNRRALHRKMVELIKGADLDAYWYDDTEVVRAINKEVGPLPKVFTTPMKRHVDKKPEQIEREIAELMQCLADSSDQGEKKKLRRMLRQRGHKGGMKNHDQ